MLEFLLCFFCQIDLDLDFSADLSTQYQVGLAERVADLITYLAI